MTKFLVCRMLHQLFGGLAVLLLLASVVLVGCTLDFLNAKPANEIKPPLPPKVDLYAGWRVFQDKCSRCHGVMGTGSDNAPDLLPIVREMNARQFTELVLKRYKLGGNVPPGSKNMTTLDEQIEEIIRRKERPIEMPAWQEEPSVNAHILDLYAYLFARTEGKFSADHPSK